MKNLFDLIQSLSREEKQYFSKFSKNDTAYYELYQVLRVLGDQSKLSKEKLPNHLGKRHIRNHLLEMTPRVMRSFKQKKNDPIKRIIKGQLMDVEFLYQHKQYKLCEETLSKLRLNAELVGDLLVLVEVNRREHYLRWHLTEKDAWPKEKEYAQENERLLKQLKIELQYEDIYYSLQRLIKNRNPQYKVSNKFAYKLFLDRNLPASMQGRRRFWLCCSLYYMLEGEMDKSYNYFAKVVDWWSEHKIYRKEEPILFFSDLRNYHYFCIERKKLEFADRIVADFEENFKNLSAHSQKILEEKKLRLKLYHYLNKNEFKEALTLIPAVEKLVFPFRPEHIEMIHNVVSLFFVTEDYEACVRWCKKVLRKKTDYLKAIQKAIWILNLLAHSELENNGDYQAKTDRFRYYQKRTPDFFRNVMQIAENAPELRLIELFGALHDCTVEKEEKLFKEIRQFLNDHPHKTKYYREEVEMWLATKEEPK